VVGAGGERRQQARGGDGEEMAALHANPFGERRAHL
jgi:hypothetical protein